MSSTVSLKVELTDQSSAHAPEGDMHQQSEIAAIVLFTGYRLWHTSTLILLEQASFGHHDHVASTQFDIAFEVLASLIGPVVEYKNRLA